ncbi:MAG: hypothetical protein IIV10_05145 [Alistipes sp.]|nr:hypothetical protein [Alistipes sp.]
MYGNDTKKPIGGIAHCALYPADSVRVKSITTNGCDVLFANQSCEFDLFDEHSSFNEQMLSDKGVLKVVHRLELIADRNLASSWLEIPFTHQAIDKGLVARLTLTDGRKLLVGYSKKFEFERPLRLSSLSFNSGSRANETPTLTLTLTSEDTAFAMPLI